MIWKNLSFESPKNERLHESFSLGYFFIVKRVGVNIGLSKQNLVQAILFHMN